MFYKDQGVFHYHLNNTAYLRDMNTCNKQSPGFWLEGTLKVL